jgi:hypothetical protein
MNEKETANVRPVGVIRANKDSKAHIHKVIIEECGTHDIPYVMNASTVLLYNPTLSLDDLLASIDVLKRDVKLRLQKDVVAT